MANLSQVLCYQAYFKQAVHESADEYYRIRNVKIYYYLEDDSIAIVEPPLRNRYYNIYWKNLCSSIYLQIALKKY